MTVAFDAQGTGISGGAGTGFTESTPQITIASGADLVLFLGVRPSSGSVSAVTALWDAGGTNQPMTQLGTVSEGANLAQIFMFGLIGATSGAQLLQTSWTNTASYAAFLFSFTGAGSFQNFISGNQSASPIAGAYPSSNAASLNCPVGDLGFFGAVSSGGANFASAAGGAGQTGTWLFYNSFPLAHMTGIYIAGAGAATICSVRQTVTSVNTACWAAFDIAQPTPGSFGVIVG